MVHNRRKRSDPTTIDSIIPINQPTDTTDTRLAKRDTTVFQGIINTFGMLLGYYPSQTPTISGRASDGMHMFQQNLTAQDELFSELIKRVEEHEEDIVLEYAYPCLVARVKDTKMFQEIVKKLEYILGHYPSQTPTISKPVYNGMHMHMISTEKPSQENLLKIPFYSEITPEAFYQYPIVGALYFDKTGRQCLKYYSYYPANN
ncbi:uncharacterized protein LOC112456839 isoform X2 [Temnothorax curvispinosus]|uniref:Uncharacterized protein LOC112456839 isoform X2 n=1 Tax=Temnothorax curvispinosus TaxID=300111 RepID=A0A6J1PZT5_9HYME|nr:uncharacterized protein LOC112456839 isoform X2 [Temnothorax curvispinosus]